MQNVENQDVDVHLNGENQTSVIYMINKNKN